MIFLKSFLVGLLAVLLSAILLLAIVIAVSISGVIGSAGIGAVSVSRLLALILGTLIFLTGFVWEYRRASRSRRSRPRA
jgi:ABC-type nickel/cobalt efflux system permease component RcnA